MFDLLFRVIIILHNIYNMVICLLPGMGAAVNLVAACKHFAAW